MTSAVEAAWLAAEADAVLYATDGGRAAARAGFEAFTQALDALHQASLAVENRSRLSVEVHLEYAREAAAAACSGDSGHLFSLIAAVEAEASAAGLLEAA